MNALPLWHHQTRRRSAGRTFLHLLLVAAFALMLAPTSAVGEQERRQPLVIKTMQDVDFEVPERGLSMDRVEERFGPPRSTRGPVGEPPITHWTYDDFRVVFEHRYVIHTVVDPRHTR